MWYSVYAWTGPKSKLNEDLRTLGHNTNFENSEDIDHSSEVCVVLSPLELIELRKHFDVMLLDRGGKDYIYLDTKGKRFTQR